MRRSRWSPSLLRKSITDLSRRRSRTFFAVATLALAVASIGLFAMPALMNRAMSAEVAADRLPDLTIYTRPLVLDQAQLAALAAVPNVRAVEPRSFFGGRVYVGARRAFAQVLGIPDFTRQPVNVVHVASGAAPGTGAVLTDVQNAKQGLLTVQAGQTRADHRRGRGRALAAGQRRGPQPRRRPDRHLRRRDRAVRHAGDRGVAERDPRLRRAVLQARRYPPGRGRCDDRGDPPYARRGPRLHRLQRPAAGARRGRLARQVQLPELLQVLLRDHPARAAVGARADLEHDDDAGRRADI